MAAQGSGAETSTTNFEFITILDPKQSQDPANRERVRRRAIQSYHQRRQRLSQGSGSSHHADVDTTSQTAPPAEAVEQAHLQNDVCSFDRGSICRLDPFRRFPVPLDPATQQLLNHREYILLIHVPSATLREFTVLNLSSYVVYDGTCPMFRTMRDIGFLNAANEESSFCQLLSTSSWHINQLRSDVDCTSHLSYSVLALRSLNQRLMVSATVLADETIGAMLAFACHSVRLKTPLMQKQSEGRRRVAN
jgi:hypothetical protein